MLDLDVLDLHPFCMLKLKRGKKPGENGGYTKRKKKGSEKRRKKGYCELLL
jgi:hypothetical protein